MSGSPRRPSSVPASPSVVAPSWAPAPLFTATSNPAPSFPGIPPSSSRAEASRHAMRILHYLPTLTLVHGGPIRAVFDLCSSLTARGHQVTIMTTQRGDAPQAWDGSTPSLPRVACLPPGVVFQRPLSRAQRVAAADIIRDHEILHLHGVWELSNIQLSAIARKQEKPYFVSLRGMLDDFPMTKSRIRKRLLHALVIKRHLELATAI